MTAQAALIWSDFPHVGSAKQVISSLLDERLIACGNILPNVPSLFIWRGERDETVECAVLFKTTAARLDAAVDRLSALHPYETPAIMGWTVNADAGTLAWLQRETGGL